MPTRLVRSERKSGRNLQRPQTPRSHDERPKPGDTTPDGLDRETAEVVETLPSGREIRRVALGRVDVVGMIDMLEQAKSNGGVFPATGATIGKTHQALADIADGLVDVLGSEMAKAVAVCRRERIEGK